jgi:dCMP deaminase
MSKRQTWEEYFLSIAKTVAQRSKDPSTKVGCVIVDQNKQPVSFGYNGFPSGIKENILTYDRPMKYGYMVHAEMNAILFAKRDLTDCIIYCTHQPCLNCLKHIIQSGIKKIYYSDISTWRKFSDDEKTQIFNLIKASDVRLFFVVDDHMDNYLSQKGMI